MKTKNIIYIVGVLWLLSCSMQAQNKLMPINHYQILSQTSLLYYSFQNDTLKKETSVNNKTIKKISAHNPKLAVLFSAVVPGAGQIYNKKYWKTPIIWAGIGTCAYFVRTNHIQYRDYKDALLQRTDTSIKEPDIYLGIYSTDQLLTLQDQYRQNRDLFIIVTTLVYVLNIVDALVDAHLYYFDVSDDLSLNWQPFYNYSVNTGNTAGLSFRLNFK